MQLDCARVVLSRGGVGRSQSLETSDIPELRKLLRTDMSIAKIAAHFGVVPATVNHFVKRRAICDLSERRRFISRNKANARADRKAAVSAKTSPSSKLNSVAASGICSAPAPRSVSSLDLAAASSGAAALSTDACIEVVTPTDMPVSMPSGLPHCNEIKTRCKA